MKKSRLLFCHLVWLVENSLNSTLKVDMIDFVVENTESENPITSIGNWHVESKEDN